MNDNYSKAANIFAERDGEHEYCTTTEHYCDLMQDFDNALADSVFENDGAKQDALNAGAKPVITYKIIVDKTA